ncbi:hypothetical protein FB567DRAFT_267587 [Paraphoma chrysanthemicola]|uniref:Uncharacterized protein n=1 Tax=Paraphoma chrysanthemicola TaxID=798071 RepID=A0A8K0RDT3_9PLEO|nr:hypothetical protein FB567DRAFT_267587 [Paraphoma chrysanthemicola]
MTLLLIIFYLSASTDALPVTSTTENGNQAQDAMPSVIWLNSISIMLICYDVFSAVLLGLLWWSGHLVWLTRPRGTQGIRMRDAGARSTARGGRDRHERIERELRRTRLI